MRGSAAKRVIEHCVLWDWSIFTVTSGGGRLAAIDKEISRVGVEDQGCQFKTVVLKIRNTNQD